MSFLARALNRLRLALGVRPGCVTGTYVEVHKNDLRALLEHADSLAAHLADAEHRAENAGRNASAFEDRMGDLQVENGKLLDEIARLHSVLEDDTRVRYYKEYLDHKRGGVEDGDL